MARRPKIQLELAFAKGRRVKPEAPAPEGPKPTRRTPQSKARRRRRTVHGGDCREGQSERGAGAGSAQQGRGGVDGMSVEALSAHLKDHWPTIRARLLDGSYEPQPVRRVEIPKPAGGVARSAFRRSRPLHPAGGDAGAAGALGRNVQRRATGFGPNARRIRR